MSGAGIFGVRGFGIYDLLTQAGSCKEQPAGYPTKPVSKCPAVQAVGCKLGDRIVCVGTAFGRFEKGQVGTIQQLDGSQALVLLDGADAPIWIGHNCFEHADGIEWELADGRRNDAAIKEHVRQSGPLPTSVARCRQLEDGLQELFRMQDLKGDGVLEEMELIKLNQKIAILHYGKDSKEAQKGVITEKYTKLFREKLDVNGDAVVYPLFREYILERLDAVDVDPRAQAMIVEQWIAEADSGREAFNCCSLASESDAPFMPRTLAH